MLISNETWTNRIANATPLELVIINYELVIYNIDQCINNIEDNNFSTFDQNIETTKNFLKELMSSLNMQVKISENLMSLYLYANKNITRAFIKKDKEGLLEAKRILTTLLSGFQMIEDDGKPVMKNSHQVYAGLTYGKHSLNENVTSFNNSRGFKA